MGSEMADEVAALRGMLDQIPAQVARYRQHDLHVYDCNLATAEALGCSREELIGRSLADVLPPEDVAQLRRHLSELGPEVPEIQKTVAWTDASGRPRWIEWQARWTSAPTGDEVFAIGHEVTDRVIAEQRLLESEQRFRIAMSDAPIGMALVGLDARFLAVNRTLCRFLDRTEDELLAMTTLDVTHPEDVVADLDYGDGSRRGVEQGSLAKRYLRPDGSVVWGLLKVSTVRDDQGEPSYIIGQVVDVTDQVAYEDRLREVAASEREAASQLRQIDEAKNAFLSAISHELRTPLTVVQGTAATLRRHGERLDAETRRSLHDALKQQAARLGQLLDELLDLDRLLHGAQAVLPTSFDVPGMLREQVRAAALEARVQLHAPAHLSLAADRVQVERIVANLLSNAAKYAPTGPIDLRLTALEGTRQGIRLEVCDRGPGIPEEDHRRVFEPFHRSSKDHPQPGTGIGLSLVRGFARLHGGDAWVAPTDVGARLVVEVPSGEASA